MIHNISRSYIRHYINQKTSKNIDSNRQINGEISTCTKGTFSATFMSIQIIAITLRHQYLKKKISIMSIIRSC